MNLSQSKFTRSIPLLVLALVSIIGLGSSPVRAETIPQAQFPALISGFELSIGYVHRDSETESSDSFYKVSYKDKLIREEGTPFKDASHLDLASPVSEVAKGDRNKLSIRLEDGAATVGGALFEMDGATPLNFAGINPEYVRGNAYVSADSDSLRYALGLETKPFRIPGLRNSYWSNWAIFGINAQRTETDDPAKEDNTAGLLTYKLFAGRAFGWRKSADPMETASKLTKDLLALAPTYEEAAATVAKIEEIDPGKRSELQQLFVDAFFDHEGGDDQGWRQTLAELAEGHADAITDQPTLSIYMENTGWYDFEADGDQDDVKNLFTATLDYWFLPQRDDVFMRVRYEYGYERATPDVRKNQLMLLLSLKF